MADRIDHAAEARLWLDGGGIATKDVLERAALAQVHAQLALVEQQRIANLLAASVVLAQVDGQYMPIGGEARLALFESIENGTATFRPNIAAALGIEVRE